MAKTPAQLQPKQSVVIGGQEVETWPSTQRAVPYVNPETRVHSTVFKGSEEINRRLVEAMLELEQDPKFVIRLTRGGCGTKIDHIDRWGVPEAELVHARAMSFFTRGLGFEQAAVDQCWGNIYRNGDYCMPHSHIRSRIAVVYLVDPGDENPESPMDGKFYFCDPRVETACDIQPHCMTRILMPNLIPGAMIAFPGAMVHGVNPYTGERPRVTLSWNINLKVLPGKPPEIR